MPRSDERDRREKPPSRAQTQSALVRSLPWLGASALGVAGVSEGLRRAFLPGTARRDLEDFASHMRMRDLLKTTANLAPDTRQLQGLVDYSILGNRAMQTRPFGIDPLTWIKGFRKITGPEWSDTESPLHYRAFQAGPLPAVSRLLEELSYGGTWQGAKPVPMNDAFRDKLHTAVTNLAGKDYLKGVEGTNSYTLRKALNPDSIPHDGQVLLARRLPDELKKVLSPQEWETFNSGIKGIDDSLFKGYSRVVRGVQAADQAWSTGSKALAGLGLAGLGGWGWLKWRERQREKAKQSSLRKQAATTYMKPTQLVKIAVDILERAKQLPREMALGNYADAWLASPALNPSIVPGSLAKSTLLGAVLGGGGGVAAGVLRNAVRAPEDKNRTSLVGAGLLGAGLGGGAGLGLGAYDLPRALTYAKEAMMPSHSLPPGPIRFGDNWDVWRNALLGDSDSLTRALENMTRRRFELPPKWGPTDR